MKRYVRLKIGISAEILKNLHGFFITVSGTCHVGTFHSNGTRALYLQSFFNDASTLFLRPIVRFKLVSKIMAQECCIRSHASIMVPLSFRGQLLKLELFTAMAQE